MTTASNAKHASWERPPYTIRVTKSRLKPQRRGTLHGAELYARRILTTRAQPVYIMNANGAVIARSAVYSDGTVVLQFQKGGQWEPWPEKP